MAGGTGKSTYKKNPPKRKNPMGKKPKARKGKRKGY